MPLWSNVFMCSIFFVALVQASEAKRGVVSERKELKATKTANKRNTIIKCCGALNCLKFKTNSTKYRSSPSILSILQTTNIAALGITNTHSTTQPASTKSQFDAHKISNADLSDSSTFNDASTNSNDQSSIEMVPTNTSASELISSVMLVSNEEKIISASTLPMETIQSTIADTGIISIVSTDSTSKTTQNDIFQTTILPVISTSTFLSSASKTLAPTSITKTSPTTTINPALVGKCSPDTNAAVNRSLFAPNGALANPNQHGFWLNACGQTLLLGKSLVS
ncbi:uncharacterized protein LOC132203308 [Neocloeon triangulifer]|uniref:uncharacterized protein LOC132203308 n=1 Tax=Neocloeon triangulifer TaxID=2078957 RepID=UPI00286F7ECD|nr:uncharacterized protein LOC132203308 [Neocloeon triangulifer]